VKDWLQQDDIPRCLQKERTSASAFDISIFAFALLYFVMIKTRHEFAKGNCDDSIACLLAPALLLHSAKSRLTPGCIVQSSPPFISSTTSTRFFFFFFFYFFLAFVLTSSVREARNA